MNSRKLNPDRSRRYIARTTPDEIQARFSAIDDDSQQKYDAWVHEFMRRMRIKHGTDVIIDVYMDEGINRVFTKYVTARVRGS